MYKKSRKDSYISVDTMSDEGDEVNTFVDSENGGIQ